MIEQQIQEVINRGKGRITSLARAVVDSRKAETGANAFNHKTAHVLVSDETGLRVGSNVRFAAEGENGLSVELINDPSVIDPLKTPLYLTLAHLDSSGIENVLIVDNPIAENFEDSDMLLRSGKTQITIPFHGHYATAIIYTNATQ